MRSKLDVVLDGLDSDVSKKGLLLSFCTQMQKTADERAKVVDAKLAEMEVTQRQIGAQIAELRGVVEQNAADFGNDFKEARLTRNQVRDEILGAMGEETADLIDGLALNANVRVHTEYSASMYCVCNQFCLITVFGSRDASALNWAFWDHYFLKNHKSNSKNLNHYLLPILELHRNIKISVVKNVPFWHELLKK